MQKDSTGQRDRRGCEPAHQTRRTSNENLESAARNARQRGQDAAAIQPVQGAALQALSAMAYANSEHAWRTRKGPMALYHRSVGIVAKRVARTLTRAERTAGRRTRRARRERTARQRERSGRTLSVITRPYGTGVARRSTSVELNETWVQIFAGTKDGDLRSVCAALRYIHGLEGMLADEAWQRRRRQSRALFHRVVSVYAGHMRRAATKALGGPEHLVEGDRKRARASVPETANEAVLRSHG